MIHPRPILSNHWNGSPWASLEGRRFRYAFSPESSMGATPSHSPWLALEGIQGYIHSSPSTWPQYLLLVPNRRESIKAES